MKTLRIVLAVMTVVGGILSADIDGGPNLGVGVGLAQLIVRLNTAFVKCKLKLGIQEGSALQYVLAHKDLKGDGCGLACIASELGYIVNGKINEANVQGEVNKTVPRAQMVTLVKAVVHECVPETSNETDPCILVLSFSNCLLNKPKEIIFGNN